MAVPGTGKTLTRVNAASRCRTFVGPRKQFLDSMHCFSALMRLDRREPIELAGCWAGASSFEEEPP
jgi:hypothetical protein